MATATRYFTIQEFTDYAATHGRCELIRGEVRELSPTGEQHGRVTNRINYMISHFVYERHLGEVYSAETGFRLDDDGMPTVRAPDIAFISTARSTMARNTSFTSITPDLVVETLSPSDRAGDVSQKIQWWLSHGVREVWVVDCDNRLVTVYLPDGNSRVYRHMDEVTAGEVLPGFKLSLSDLVW